MQSEVIRKLINLNQEFYQTFATPFSETRERVQPGVLKAIATIPQSDSVLDLGCGNGNLPKALAAQGHKGLYIGVDFSPDLLAAAESTSIHPNAQFRTVNISNRGWSKGLSKQFDQIVAFAVLHHIPSQDLRTQVVEEVRACIQTEGRFTFSVWNFLESPRLRDRIVAWSEVEISEDELESGDYLLDWKRGGYGLRYVHAFEDEELLRLAQGTGFEVIDTYSSDGEGGKLGSYQVWAPR